MISGFGSTFSGLFLSVSPILFGTVASAQWATPPQMRDFGGSSPRSARAFVQSTVSTYRDFQFGMSLTAGVKHSGMDQSEVLTIHERPAIIQGLDWNPERFSRDPAKSDPVERVQFAFYNGKLSRALITMVTKKTRGLSVGDMIQAQSVQYGTAVRPTVSNSFPSASFSADVAILATWEDSRYSVNLVQSPYGGKFGLVAFSKKLNRIAEESVATGLHMDTEEAPRREKQGQQKTQDELAKA